MKSSETNAAAISRPIVGGPRDTKSSLPVRIARRLMRIRSTPTRPVHDRPDPPLKVVCVSDTHNTTPALPAGDILVHSGDLTQYGTFKELQRQLDWLNAQPHAHKIVVAGNHDLLLDVAFVARHPDRELDRPGAAARDLDWGSIVYLEKTSAELGCGARTIRVFGSPETPRCGNFAFQYDSPAPSSPREQSIWTGRVPVDTDIRVTHGPPALHLDGGGKGCGALLTELWRTRPALVVFGHIHHARGRETMVLSPSQRLFEDIALAGGAWSKLPLLLWRVCAERLRTPSRYETISLVNAACHDGEGCLVVEI